MEDQSGVFQGRIILNLRTTMSAGVDDATLTLNYRIYDPPTTCGLFPLTTKVYPVSRLGLRAQDNIIRHPRIRNEENKIREYLINFVKTLKNNRLL